MRKTRIQIYDKTRIQMYDKNTYKYMKKTRIQMYEEKKAYKCRKKNPHTNV